MSAVVVQGTPEWFAARLGRVTASRVADVMAKIKSGEAATRATYRAELVAERLTGKAAEGFSSPAMRWGTECEPLARAAYELHADELVQLVGFVEHPRIAMAGASPDGLVGADGLIEIKCPETRKHIATIRSREAPAEYRLQMQWQMACTGRAWCDFVSFDPRLPARMQIFVQRVKRDDELIEQMEAEVERFLSELAAEVADLEQWALAA